MLFRSKENKTKQNKRLQESNKNVQTVNNNIYDSLNPRILAKQIFIKGENKRIFNDFILKIREEVPTHSKIEEEFLKKYIFSAWKLQRMRMLERLFLNKQQTESKGYDFASLSDDRKKTRIRNLSKIEIDDNLNRIFLLQNSLEKQMVKALKQLREEQKNR